VAEHPTRPASSASSIKSAITPRIYTAARRCVHATAYPSGIAMHLGRFRAIRPRTAASACRTPSPGSFGHDRIGGPRDHRAERDRAGCVRARAPVALRQPVPPTAPHAGPTGSAVSEGAPAPAPTDGASGANLLAPDDARVNPIRSAAAATSRRRPSCPQPGRDRAGAGKTQRAGLSPGPISVFISRQEGKLVRPQGIPAGASRCR